MFSHASTGITLLLKKITSEEEQRFLLPQPALAVCPTPSLPALRQARRLVLNTVPPRLAEHLAVRYRALLPDRPLSSWMPFNILPLRVRDVCSSPGPCGVRV
jgi:hypothetical protein